MRWLTVCGLVLLAGLGLNETCGATVGHIGSEWVVTSKTMTIRISGRTGYIRTVHKNALSRTDMMSSAISPLILKNGVYANVPLPVPTVMANSIEVRSTYHFTSPALTLVVDYIPKGDYIAVNASIQNKGTAADYWMKIILCLPLYNPANASRLGYFSGLSAFYPWGGGHYETGDPWDPSGTGGMNQDWIYSMFPISCTMDTDYGMAIGITPDYRVSFRQALYDAGPTDFSIKYALKVVVPPDNAATTHCNFLIYGFTPTFNENDAIAEYYKLFPTKYAPAAEINQKALATGTALHVRDQEQVELTGSPKYSFDDRRRAFGGITWWYAPWKKDGFFYGDPSVQADVNQWNAPLASFSGQDPIPSYFTQSLPNYNAAQYTKFVDASHWDFQNMYYILTWCEKGFAESSYPGYRITDDNNNWQLIPRWTQGWGEDYDMWMNGAFLADTETRLSNIANNWRVDGFAFDVCDDMLKAKNFGQATNNITGRNERSYTINGTGGYSYIENAIGHAQLMDYIHTLKNSNGQKMTVWANAWYGFTENVGWGADCMLVEDHFARVLGSMDQFCRDRRMLGSKPREFMEFTVPNEGAYVNVANWQSMSAAEIQQWYRDLWNKGILAMFYVGILPSEDQLYGYQIGMNAMPVLTTVIPAGWQPVSAMSMSTDTGSSTDLWRARYGTDLSAYMWIGNQNSTDSSSVLTINNKYLEAATPTGSYTYLFANYDNSSLYQRFVSNAATNQTQLYPSITHYKYALAKSVAKINAKLNGFDGAVSIIGDHSSGIVDGYINSPSSGYYTMTTSIPVDAHCTDVSYHIGTGAAVHPAFNNTKAGLVTWTIPFTASSYTVFDVSWASDVQLSSDTALRTYTYVNSNYTPRVKIVIPDGADEWDNASAARVQEYFRYYYSKVYGQSVVIPIIPVSQAGGVANQICIGVDFSATPIISLANSNNYVQVTGPNSKSRFDAVSRLLRLLDGQYAYLGTIVAEPTDKSSAAYGMRQKAGLLTGGVLSGS